MYKLSLVFCNQAHIFFVFIIIITTMISIALVQHFFRIHKLTNEKFLLKDQEHHIEKLYLKIKSLYQELFELEELCENLILELQDEHKQHFLQAHKKRIIQSTQSDSPKAN